MEKRIGNARSAGIWKKIKRVLSPSEKKDMGREYFGYETRKAIQSQLKYAPNMFRARVQGVNEKDFYRYYDANVRLADAVDSRTGVNVMEDWKEMLFEDPVFNRIGLGAKVVTGDDTYLVTNPNAKSGMNGTAILRRCNAVWKHLDFYGNVLEEPFVWMKQQVQASANEYLYYMVVPNLYQKCVMQINADTKELTYNRRMVLVSSAYEVRGLIDFLQDTTKDADSTHLYYFDLQFQQTIAADDTKREIADAYGFSWELKVNGLPAMAEGQTAQMIVTSIRNGRELSIEDGVTYGQKDAQSERERYGEKPFHYLYQSKDATVATVDDTGLVTAVSPGECVITVTLAENQDIQTNVIILVGEAENGPVWVRKAEEMGQYKSAEFECRMYENGVQTDENAVYTVECQDENAASWTVENGVLTLTGYIAGESVTVKATVGGETAETVALILGY